MKLIVGLGNPGKKYQNTRHNFGFLLLDHLAKAWGFHFSNSSKYKGEFAEVRDKTHQKIFFIKPQTFMNLSGESVGPLATFYKISPQDVLVIYDDVDMPLGKTRFARQGRSGGHNGVKSIIDCLGSQEFPRLKLGIGRPQIVQKEVTDHVLEKFSKDDKKIVMEVLDKCEQALKAYLLEGIENAMNSFN